MEIYIIMVLESKIQKKITDYLTNKEWCICIKITSSNWNWVPDVLVLLWWWKHIFIEVKKPDWVESKLQQFRRKQLTEHGDISLVCYSFDDFLTQYQWLKKDSQ